MGERNRMDKYYNADRLYETLIGKWNLADVDRKTAISEVMEDIVIPIVKNFPASDVKPVVYGEWYDVGSLSCRCNQCGCKNNKETDYCPNCGAKMRGKREIFPNIVGEDAEMFVDGEWIGGKIVNSYRFKDGIVTIETPDGKRYWCGEARKELYRKVGDNV